MKTMTNEQIKLEMAAYIQKSLAGTTTPADKERGRELVKEARLRGMK